MKACILCSHSLKIKDKVTKSVSKTLHGNFKKNITVSTMNKEIENYCKLQIIFKFKRK